MFASSTPPRCPFASTKSAPCAVTAAFSFAPVIGKIDAGAGGERHVDDEGIGPRTERELAVHSDDEGAVLERQLGFARAVERLRIDANVRGAAECAACAHVSRAVDASVCDAVAVVVLAVGAYLRRTGVDRRIGVIAVARGDRDSVGIRVARVGRRDIGRALVSEAVAVVVLPVSYDLRRAWMDRRVVVVAVAARNGCAAPVRVVVRPVDAGIHGELDARGWAARVNVEELDRPEQRSCVQRVGDRCRRDARERRHRVVGLAVVIEVESVCHGADLKRRDDLRVRAHRGRDRVARALRLGRKEVRNLAAVYVAAVRGTPVSGGTAVTRHGGVVAFDRCVRAAPDRAAVVTAACAEDEPSEAKHERENAASLRAHDRYYPRACR